jgi:hypothetical protein
MYSITSVSKVTGYSLSDQGSNPARIKSVQFAATYYEATYLMDIRDSFPRQKVLR